MLLPLEIISPVHQPWGAEEESQSISQLLNLRTQPLRNHSVLSNFKILLVSPLTFQLPCQLVAQALSRGYPGLGAAPNSGPQGPRISLSLAKANRRVT